MPRGDKSSHTEKQKRQAKHIEASELERGHSEDTAERIAWTTVNKQGGGKRKGHEADPRKESSNNNRRKSAQNQ